MYLLVLCVGAALLLLFTAWRTLRNKQRRARVRLLLRGKQLKLWLAEYRAIDDEYNYEELVALRPCPDGWDDLPEVQSAKNSIARARRGMRARTETAKREAEHRADVNAQLAEIRSSDAPVEELLDKLIYLRSQSEFLSTDDALWVAEQLRQFADNKANRLLELARGGDRQEFFHLSSFTSYVRFITNYPHDAYGFLAKDHYDSPPDWDDLLVRYVENPGFHDFRCIPLDFNPGDCGLLAAEALRTRSLRNAQLVLAMCKLHERDGRHPWREEIGDVLLAEVTKLVDQLHIEQRLTFADTTTQ